MDIDRENCLSDDEDDDSSYVNIHNIEQLYINVKNRMDRL